MNLLYKIIFSLNNIPFKLKGGKIGKNSYIGPGYDFIGLNMKGINIANNVLIGRNATISLSSKRGRIIIGNKTNIARFANIAATKKITIGKECVISYNTSILDHDHIFNIKPSSPIYSGITEGKEVIIGDNCFVGAHCFILKGVKLGKHCVVGANSVVNKSFPDYSVIAGNPAKLIKKLTKI